MKNQTCTRLFRNGLLVGMAWWVCAGATAAGLGEITVRSALGQPLNADIALLTADKRDLGSLAVSIAPASAHREAGIPNQTVALGLKATLQTGKDGRTTVRVESLRPVVEPTMRLLIELRGPSTNALREYALLLDPPELQRR
jgi:pilus assembly protein FimV